MRRRGTAFVVALVMLFSTILSGKKKGFGIGKAVIGASTLGPLGLVMGNIGAKKIRVTCLKCGKKFKA